MTYAPSIIEKVVERQRARAKRMGGIWRVQRLGDAPVRLSFVVLESLLSIPFPLEPLPAPALGLCRESQISAVDCLVRIASHEGVAVEIENSSLTIPFVDEAELPLVSTASNHDLDAILIDPFLPEHEARHSRPHVDGLLRSTR